MRRFHEQPPTVEAGLKRTDTKRYQGERVKAKLIAAAVAAAMAGWAAPGFAQQVVALPGVVGPVGVTDGVQTIGPGLLTVGNQNINTKNLLSGGITTSAANTANILFTGNSTVSGFTGTALSTFLGINAGANGTTVTFNGDVFSTTFTVSGTGIVNFNGNVTGAPAFGGDGFINLGAGQTITGAITTAAAGTGSLTLGGGSTVVGAVGGGNGLRLISLPGGNATITGAVQTLGLNLGANTLNITGALTTNAGATIATTLASNLVFGNVKATGASNINAGGITVTPTVTGVLTNGTTFNIVNAPAGTNGATVFVVNNSPRYTFVGLPTTLGNVNIQLSGVAPLATLVSSPGAAAVAPILDINAAPGSDLLAVQNAIAVLPNAAAINNALMQLAPGTANLAAPLVAAQSTRMFEDMWMGRMEEIQGLCCSNTCEARPAVPAYAQKCATPEQRGKWWARAFDNQGRQGSADNLNGYRSNASGLMLAYDTPLGEHTRAGLGIGAVNTAIDGDNASGRTTITSYQLTGYLSQAVGAGFVQGAVTAGRDSYRGSRSIVFPGVSRTASSNYSGSQYTALVAAGQHFPVGGNIVTPLASLQVSRIRVDGYAEGGAGDIDLQVNRQSYNFVQSSLGVKAERVMHAGSATFSPEVHAKWLHDFSSTTMRETAAFTGGGGSFTVQGISQNRELFNVGAGVTFLSCSCGGTAVTVKALYDYKWNQSNYSSNQVALLGSIRF
ncbi:MAG: hypothetical protein JWN73_3611 [Betaproteobacteria bacterium]|nr:hypothetical protein [Betaproteobacteria bacterium]